MKSKRSILIVAIGLASVLVIALFQERPGRGDWITSLAGDWSIDLCNDYVIGPSLDLPDGNYEVFRWREIGEEKYALEFVVDGIKTYRICGDEVLLRSNKEWILTDAVTRERAVCDGPRWILVNTLTGEQAIYDDPNLPYRLEGFAQDMEVPRQSLRTRLLLLASVLGGILIYLLIRSSKVFSFQAQRLSCPNRGR